MCPAPHREGGGQEHPAAHAPGLTLPSRSAGGTGVLLNVDRVADQLAQLGYPGIQVRGLADSGWFLDNQQYRRTDCVDTITCAPTEAIRLGIRCGWTGGGQGQGAEAGRGQGTWTGAEWGVRKRRGFVEGAERRLGRGGASGHGRSQHCSTGEEYQGRDLANQSRHVLGGASKEGRGQCIRIRAVAGRGPCRPWAGRRSRRSLRALHLLLCPGTGTGRFRSAAGASSRRARSGTASSATKSTRRCAVSGCGLLGALLVLPHLPRLTPHCPASTCQEASVLVTALLRNPALVVVLPALFLCPSLGALGLDTLHRAGGGDQQAGSGTGLSHTPTHRPRVRGAVAV